jgi:hypothetical protein
MAGTETITEEPRTVRETLRAYDVLETGVETSPIPSQNASQQAVQSERNWPSDWRRMPAYRETSRTHRVSDRAAGQGLVESGIVLTMFSGVWMMGVRVLSI